MPTSLRLRLALTATAIVLVSLAAFMALNYVIARRAMLEALNYSLGNVTAVHAQLTAAWIDTQRRVVEAASEHRDDTDGMQTLAQARKSGHFFATYIGYPNKRLISDPVIDVPADYDPTSRDWYKLASQTQSTVVTEPYVDASSGQLVLTFAKARVSNGAVTEVLGADVHLDSVAGSIAAARPSEHGFALLISETGVILAHADKALWMKPLTTLDPALDLARIQNAAGSNDWIELPVKGERHYLQAVRVAGTRWILLLASPERDVMADLYRRMGIELMALLAIATVALLLCHRLLGAQLGRLLLVSEAMAQVGDSDGDADLTRRLPAQGRDEVAAIAASFNRFADRLAGTLQGVRDASGAVAVASRQISSGSQDLSRRTEDAASRLQRTASELNEIVTTVRQGAQHAADARQLANAAAGVARQGQETVRRVISTMHDIHAASRRIADIIGVIDSIAFQTNILALNAAVEAARAGEQGRGFAVVAGEVRGLAQRSAEAAREISGLIGTSVEGVERGSQLVSDSGQVMEDIVGSVERVGSTISQVTEAARRQLDGMEGVHAAVAALDQMTQQNAALAEESAAAAESLDGQAARLTAAVAVFRLHGDEPTGEALPAPGA